MKLSYNTVESLLIKIEHELTDILFDWTPYDVKEELDKKGITVIEYQKEKTKDFENEIKTLWPTIEPHMKRYCKIFEEPTIKSPEKLFEFLNNMATKGKKASEESVIVADNNGNVISRNEGLN